MYPKGSEGSKDLYHLDFANKCTKKLAPHPASPRINGAGMASFRGHLVMCGGRTGGYSSHYFKECYEYNPVTEDWTHVGDLDGGWYG